MDQMTALVQSINSWLWGITGLIPLLVGVGIYFTFRLNFVQIRKFGQAMRFTFHGLSLHGERAGKAGMTPVITFSICESCTKSVRYSSAGRRSRPVKHR